MSDFSLQIAHIFDSSKPTCMKAIIITLFSLFLFINRAQTQTYANPISYAYVEIVKYSYKFTYTSTGTYSPYVPQITYQDALRTMQARYDYNHARVSTEYFKFKDLQLINVHNKKTLADYKTQRLDWVYNAGSTWDLGETENAEKILAYCCEIYTYASIKQELSLLQAVYREVLRLKTKDPDNFYKSDRYKTLGEVLNKLANCELSELGQLAWDNGLTL